MWAIVTQNFLSHTLTEHVLIIFIHQFTPDNSDNLTNRYKYRQTDLPS